MGYSLSPTSEVSDLVTGVFYNKHTMGTTDNNVGQSLKLIHIALFIIITTIEINSNRDKWLIVWRWFGKY